MTTNRFVRDLAGFEGVADAWDALAVASGRPACSPAVMLAWQRHVAPRTEFVSVLVYDDATLIGIAPLVLDRTNGRDDVRLMGAGLIHRLGFLARPGSERVLGAAVGEAVGAISPRPDVIALEAVSTVDGWPAIVREGFERQGRTRMHWTSRGPAPIVTIQDHTFESWMATRSSNFRSDMRRTQRRLEKRGGKVRLVTGGSGAIESAVRALGALHRGRWVPEGKPGIIGTAAEEMLLDVAREQPDGSRFRLWVVELEGVVISAQVFLAAGNTVTYWNGGWDQQHGDLKPGMLGILAAIEDATIRGEHRLDLGGGAQPYKLRFADANDPLEWAVVAPVQARYARTRLELLRQQSRWHAGEAFHRLPSDAQVRIKSLIRRG